MTANSGNCWGPPASQSSAAPNNGSATPAHSPQADHGLLPQVSDLGNSPVPCATNSSAPAQHDLSADTHVAAVIAVDPVLGNHSVDIAASVAAANTLDFQADVHAGLDLSHDCYHA